MNGLLLLLCCVEVLGMVSCQDHGSTSSHDPNTQNSSLQDTAQGKGEDETPSSHFTTTTSNMSEATSLMSTKASAAVSVVTKSHSTSSSSGLHTGEPTHNHPTPTPTPGWMFYRKECLQVFIVTGGLIIGCTILLVCTLILTCRVCQLSRHLKMLTEDADLISNSEYWMGTARKNKSKSETEAKETSMLMADVNHAQEDVGDGITKQEAGEVNKDGQTEEETKKEVGDTANSEKASADESKKDTPVTVTENSSSANPQEDATDSQATKAEAASSSEGAEAPKDAV
ncbi:uncharacterized protein LOC121190492 [Toxotes jaculatrix]|uniref:uncharacterized protein LOC121190492 n=1 Tax=Toxotes jaculatrix TaxID=941984 RepID=UPI001B3A9D79|nr:uncharacterized protein LOC121190492 [Toxotes jaculatrix]